MAYNVNVNPGATLVTIDHCIVEIWNPHASRWLRLLELHVHFQAAAPAADAGFVTRRSTAKGTPASTITPGAVHHIRGTTAPDTGFTIELGAFSAQPTLTAGELAPSW